MNQYETNAMIQKFEEAGYEIVQEAKNADISVVNTCTVTNMSDRKSRQMLRRCKEQNKDCILIATGCYAQVGKEKLEEISEIDLILGNNEKNDIVKYVEEYMQNKEEISLTTDLMYQKEFREFGSTTYTEKTRAFIKIQDGCDRFCSYCIIPYARGRVRSRVLENILEEVNEIVGIGIQEIVVTGIHIASYGKDLKQGIGLIDLLEKLNEIQGLKRIRIGSLEPLIITEEFIARLKKLEKVCPQFHLSLQSGCNETLKRMNRRYTTDDILKIANLLKENYTDVILTTDIIVGFPGETENEFNETYEFLKKIGLYKIHVFKYSKREGTKAAVMPNQVIEDTKDIRSKKIIELSNENINKTNQKYIGQEVEVLIEEKENGYFIGHTKNYILVKSISVDENINNKMVKVLIDSSFEEYLTGNVTKL